VIRKAELQLKFNIIILKNVADMPTEQDWLTYAEWGRKWGQSFKFHINVLLMLFDQVTLFTFLSSGSQ